VKLRILVFALVASCAAPRPTSKTTDAPKAVGTVAAPRPAAKPKPVLGIVEPRPGEPAPSALREARLVATTCEDIAERNLEARLTEMRRAVDESLKAWREAQPGCWKAMREDWRERQRLRSDPFGAGGLGLSGTGEGGGGRGEGIGLGLGAGVAGRFSRTNTQVAAVDEADMVKTDGRWVYLATSGALRIIEALRPRVVSVTPLDGAPRELFVDGDQAVVFASSRPDGDRCTYGYDCTVRGSSSETTISVFDIRDRTRPRLRRRIELSGSLIASRRVGQTVFTVVADGDTDTPYDAWPADLPMCGTPEDVVRARVARLRIENERRIRAQATALPTITERGTKTKTCGSVYETSEAEGRAFTTLFSLDLTDDGAPGTSTTIRSRPGNVYASEDALYVSVVRQRNARRRFYGHYGPAVDEVTEIHKFRIGARPADTRYVGSGTVPGHTLSQFAMDEWNGYLRVATTRGRVPDPNVSSAVSLLSETASGVLVRVGAVENLAPGEDIRAVRFDDERAYVVTFKKTDPLFVLDTLDPRAPRVLGELKIPGFSTYLHRVDPGHLLSIGFDANDHGDFAYYDGVLLQLFDVREPARPTLLFKEKIGSRGSSSEAATDHLAFNYDAERGRLAVPMTVCEGGDDGSNGKLAWSGLSIYDVDVERGFTRRGGIDHGLKGTDCATWWSRGTSVVKRSIFLDDLVYSVALDRVKVQDVNRLGKDVADVPLVP